MAGAPGAGDGASFGRSLRRRARPWIGAALALLLSLLCAACGGVLNPPIPTATPLPTVPPAPTALPPTPTPVPERWVKNHRLTAMWSGPARDRTAISFGETSNVFCSFRIDLAEDDARVYVYNPYADGRFWIDAEAVGPVVPPDRLRGPKPPDQNCAEAIYDPLIGTPVTATPTPSTTPTLSTPATPATPGTPRITGASSQTSTPTAITTTR